ncbi:MAG: hypothetical protein ACR65R_20540 [Methylomicrobium sp.]
MATSTVLFLVAIGAAIVWGVLFGGRLPAPFGARSCQGKNWRQSFPDASKEEIRQFLSTFTESFAFQDREKLKLNPNDQLLGIYRTLYPHKWRADALEFETLGEALESEYGISLNKAWREGLTLGQLFHHVRQATK